MPVNIGSQDWTRPVTSTAAKAITPTADIAAVSGAFVVDVYGTVNSLSKVLTRIRIPVEFSGFQFRVGSQFLLFPGSAANYSAGGTTPANAAAISTTDVVYSPYIDLNNFYTAAGEEES